MKTILTLCLLALTLGAQAQEKVKVLTAGDVHLAVGGEAELVINMDYDTAESVVGWNLYLYLPEGVDLLYDEDEEDYVYTVSSALHKKKLRSQFGIKPTTDGGYLLRCIDIDELTPMSGTHGELVRLTLVADATAADISGGLIKDIALSNEQGVSLDLNNIQDVPFAITVDGGVPTGIKGLRSSADGSRSRYNTQGQPVTANYRGIVVEDGCKVVRK